MREVQRKVFDGEISDNVLNVSKWPESMNSPALLNPSDVFDATPLMDDQVLWTMFSKSFLQLVEDVCDCTAACLLLHTL